tara:strand:+ start:783 stop:1709 length:927 start_codon:yes stop_codon:yes gene_type:complete
MKYYIYILSFLFILSCTKEIEIIIPNNGKQFVVNGFIENGDKAKVLLTRSLSYFEPLNIEDLPSTLINDATIIVTNSYDQVDTLTQQNGLTDTWSYNYIGNTIYGEEGVTYRLDITKDDTILSSITTIPNLAPLTKDSFNFVYRPFDSTYCYLYAYYQDPDTIGNAGRYFTKTNNEQWFVPNLDQAGNYNDEYINGDGLGFPIYKGKAFWQEWDYGEDWDENEVDGVSGPTIGFWNIGDTVEVKTSSVDRASWDFWNSIQYNNPAGPFGNPTDVISNITGGLGVWSGMSSETTKLVADPEQNNPIIPD